MKPTLPILIFTLLTACTTSETIQNRDDFQQYYDEYGVKGSFVLYQPSQNTHVFYNQAQYTKAFSPASTFKICNSLIGLETGVISDENFVIPWDSTAYPNPNWCKDNNLKMAFENSTVWYYQELARRVGEEKMQHWLTKASYGNADISGGIDMFWLEGGLRISPQQQIDFLQRLHDNQLPFSQRSMDIVKKIMLRQDTLDYVVRGKTGWGFAGDHEIGWYVGYLEKGEEVYYFANCIQMPTMDTNNYNNFNVARTEIVDKALAEMGLTE